MKKKMAVVLFVFLITAIHGGLAFGANFDAIYTVATSGDTTAKDTFDIDGPAPYLYLRIPSTGIIFTNNETVSFWFPPGETTTNIDYGTGPVTATEVWHPFPENWAANATPGLWTVEAQWTYQVVPPEGFENLAQGSGSTTFTVTPEPVSSILFLVGGAGLVTRRYLKAKK